MEHPATLSCLVRIFLATFTSEGQTITHKDKQFYGLH